MRKGDEEPPEGTAVGSHWFEDTAAHLGSAYLRYSFTRGTTQEVDFLIDVLELEPGMSVLDVGCGPGRHALELASRGMRVTGLDISQEFVDLATSAATELGVDATFERCDARAIGRADAFDAAISLCQGAFGLQGATGPVSWSAIDEDVTVAAEIAAALHPHGRVALSAFSSYFQVRFLEDSDRFDAATGVNHERTELRGTDGSVIEGDLWTSCFTPRELRLIAERVGLTVTDIFSVAPGRYGRDRPVTTSPEFLLVASKP
ncbi:MAG: methyltransferase domain-containing protein [Actinobacteria bacterium]|nr:methyltransferase domain-containing protein [Actinomycetota bacterium]